MRRWRTWALGGSVAVLVIAAATMGAPNVDGSRTTSASEASPRTHGHRSGAMHAVSASRTAVADAYTDAAAPGRRLGASPVLQVRGRPRQRAYLRFLVGSLAPGSRVVLRLYPRTSGRGLVVRALRRSDWRETSLTARRAPTGLRPGAVISKPITAGRPTVIDVTRLIGARRLLDLLLVGGNSKPIRFASREAPGHAPRLIIVTRSGGSPAPVPAAQTRPIVVAAAGDVACDPSSGGFNGGRGSASGCQQQATANLISAMAPDAVLMVGDAQYETGTAANFAASYDRSWGAFKSITWATAGASHDFDGGGDFYAYFGLRAGPRPFAPYSFELGRWHVVVLNANCDDASVGGCGPGSPQDSWLQADLAAHPAPCTVAMWHQARFSSGPRHGTDPRTDAFVRRLYAAGAEIVLSAHDHLYERFAPQTPDGTREDARGLVQFVVGTGGKSLEDSIGNVERNSEVRQNTSFGVLKLTLKSDGYDWEFVPTPGGTFSERGSRACH